MERRVDLSKLPTKKYGTGTCIDWKKAVGQKIPFCYDNVRGELTIVEHQKENYNDKVKREKAIKKMQEVFPPAFLLYRAGSA